MLESISILHSFNSRTPGGVRPCELKEVFTDRTFQFTHPGRGATACQMTSWTRRLSFNSRTPGGVRRVRHGFVYLLFRVSIHAPREGCDFRLVFSIDTPKTFQFTHPGRGATEQQMLDELTAVTFQFTHPGRGATARVWGCTPLTDSFNSRTPGGVRRKTLYILEGKYGFQFTHPGRGATYEC